MTKVYTGLDLLRDGYWKQLKGLRLGLLSNQASLDNKMTPATKVISEQLPGNLKAIFGPQHGHEGEDQDNMVETDHSRKYDLNIPVFSLYKDSRAPSSDMLDLIDLLIIDLQDVGTRVYTFITTMLYCLRAAAKSGKKVLILDRPNPIGGAIVEGNLLEPELYSFVGPYRLPMRHGMTMAELGLMFNSVYKIGCDLEAVKMQGWRRNMIWPDTGLRWVMPSPNMPHPDTAQVYPGQILWEGTNLSEGRGTCRPFEMFGAPYINTKRVQQNIPPEALSGCLLQEILFRPTFHKWAEKPCRGFMIHVLDSMTYQPYFTSIALLQAVIKEHPDRFLWKDPPYEYEHKKMPIDMILGSSDLRKNIETGKEILEIKKEWLSANQNFLEWRKPYLLYN